MKGGFAPPQGSARATWYRLHRACQLTGVVGMLGGFVAIAVHKGPAQFVGFGVSLAHMYTGIVVIALGLQQPIFALLRPHKPDAGEEPSALRAAWEVAHKYLGWLALLGGVTNCALGAAVAAAKYESASRSAPPSSSASAPRRSCASGCTGARGAGACRWRRSV